MILLFLILLLFAAAHIVPMVPAVRAGLKAQLGRGFGPVYGILSLLLLIALVWAFRAADREVWYDPPSWGRHANYLFTLIGFIFVGIFLFRGSWRTTLRVPVTLGVLFWAAGHLLANGDNTTTLMFGGLAVVALIQAGIIAQRPREPTPVRDGHNMLSILAGLALYALATQLHAVMVGVPVFQLG
jgi:uncharacterized membrane protein